MKLPMQRFVLFLYIILGPYAYGQNLRFPAIFESKEFDFGYIKEENGAVFVDFVFKNNELKKIAVSQAKASCGCTTPEWSKDSIPVGAKGFIRVSYNPLNRPGPFRKTVKVSFNGDTLSQTLVIKGVVLIRPKNLSPFGDRMGDLAMASRYLHLGNIKDNQTVTKDFEWVNEGFQPITIVRWNGPKWITATWEPAVLLPKGKGVLHLRYDPALKKDLGYVEDLVDLITSGDSVPEKQLVVSATIEEYFPMLTEEEIKSAPKIQFAKTEFETWKIPQGDKVEAIFPFVNMGKKKLIIRRIKTNCSCTTAEANKSEINPEESGFIKVIFQTEDREGWEEKLITVYTNDPSAPVKTLKMRVSIAKTEP